MPPKNKSVNEPKLLLGRPSNNLKIGIVGLPNVGSAPAENFPFCTIDPSEAKVNVPDSRFDYLCNLYQPVSRVPAYLTVIDIAGLVKGASQGQGLGNAFLSHIRAVDAIYHVTRAFSDEEIVHVEGDLNPVRDLEIIRQELVLKDIELLQNYIEQTEKAVQRLGNSSAMTQADKTRKEDLEIAKQVLQVLKDDKEIRSLDWTNRQIEGINRLQLITAKKVIYLVNLSETDYIRKKNKFLIKIKQWVESHNKDDTIIPMCAQLEYEYSLITKDSPNLDKEMEEQKQKFIKERNFQSVFNKIIVAGYNSLNLINFFTCGKDEVRAWTIRKNTKAPQAAGTIHTDFERGFIMAEVMSYNDLKELGSETEVKNKGKYMQKGRDYIVSDGDIILFKFNVTTTASTNKKK